MTPKGTYNVAYLGGGDSPVEPGLFLQIPRSEPTKHRIAWVPADMSAEDLAPHINAIMAHYEQDRQVWTREAIAGLVEGRSYAGNTGTIDDGQNDRRSEPRTS